MMSADCHVVHARLFLAEVRTLCRCDRSTLAFSDLVEQRCKMKRVLQIPCKLQQRVIIHFCQQLGITLALTAIFLKQVFQVRTLCDRSIRGWYHAFRNGCTRITDYPRASKIWHRRSAGNIQAVKHLIEGDRRLAIKNICAETSLTYGTVRRILKRDLGLVRKAAKMVPKMLTNHDRNLRLTLCELWKRHQEFDPSFLCQVITMDESWVYMYEPETKQQLIQWVAKGSACPVKFKRTRATGKVLVITFFDHRGLIHREFLRGQTVNRYNFIQILHRMRLAVIARRPRMWHNFVLHMDNVPAHRARLTKMFLQRMNIPVMPHPPYSPDLAPNDFFFYPTLKLPMRGQRFRSLDDLEEAVDEHIGRIPAYKYWDCILRAWP